MKDKELLDLTEKGAALEAELAHYREYLDGINSKRATNRDKQKALDKTAAEVQRVKTEINVVRGYGSSSSVSSFKSFQKPDEEQASNSAREQLSSEEQRKLMLRNVFFAKKKDSK